MKIDLPGAALNHRPPDLTREDERRGEVGRDRPRPHVVSVLDGRGANDRARVVDEDVDRPRPVGEASGELMDLGLVGEVRPDRLEGASERLDRTLDLGAGALELGAHADDVGPGGREELRDGPANAATRAGDDGELAREVKEAVDATRLRGGGHAGPPHSTSTFIARPARSRSKASGACASATTSVTSSSVAIAPAPSKRNASSKSARS